MMERSWLVAAVALSLCAGYIANAQGQDWSDYIGKGPFDWRSYDNFDEIDDRMNSINMQNCHAKPAEELHLPRETLAQLPRFNKLLSTIIYPNRTDLLHLHNMALNRAFFYSYMYQKLNDTEDFMKQPGLMYYMFSAAADVSANEYNINGSAIMFDNNCSYANWYDNLPFNKTLPLFGPRAWRFDDFNDPTNWLREPTNETIDIVDYGAGSQSNYSHKSYKINEWYDLWLPDGEEQSASDSVYKNSYDVGIKYSNETGKFESDEYVSKTFFGPPSPGQKEKEILPVVFTEPYFDCGRSNKWIVSAVAPVVDQLPRYLEWFHLRRFRFVASSVQDIDFLSIDINQCPLGIGNEAPNYFAGTAKCKSTTMCEPLYHGFGFRRGGYRCVCKPGYRYPHWQRGPFMGIDIESATEEEYERGFDCIRVELRIVIPLIRSNETRGTPEYDRTNVRKKREVPQLENKVQERAVEEELAGGWWQPARARRVDRAAEFPAESLESRILNKQRKFLRSINLKEQESTDRKKRSVQPGQTPLIKTDAKKRKVVFQPRYKRNTDYVRHRREAFDQQAYIRMTNIIEHKETVNADNCARYKPEELELPGDVSYGVEKQLSYQARTALRLSHFLSNFLQNIDVYEEYGNLRGDRLLNVEQLFGEVLSNVMGDLKMRASGIFYDIDKFEGPDGETRQFFGPYAYRYEEDTPASGQAADRANTHFRAIDFAGFSQHYLDKPWFKFVKERWQSNHDGLTKFTEKPMIRSDLAGTSLKKFELYPLYYKAPNEEDGWWSAPYFDCGGFVNDWIMTYSIPFFGLNSIRSDLEFKGVVTIDVKLDELDIQQCPGPFHEPNAFKNTARCDYETTYCEHLPSKRFTRGNYKCECKQGFEYPFNDRAWYYDGQTMEEEYRKLVEGQSSRFHTLKCRIAGASRAAHSWVVLLLVCVASWLTTHAS